MTDEEKAKAEAEERARAEAASAAAAELAKRKHEAEAAKPKTVDVDLLAGVERGLAARIARLEGAPAAAKQPAKSGGWGVVGVVLLVVALGVAGAVAWFVRRARA